MRTGFEIAVIGMAGRFPGAKNLDEFWENLKNGVESIAYLSDKELEEAGTGCEMVDNPDFVKSKGGIIENRECFDAAFFEYTVNEASIMDPQMRLLHESVWAALEDAGCNPYTYDGPIGLYAGAASNFHWKTLAASSGITGKLGDFLVMQLVEVDFFATRVSYKLDLKGPAISVQTACSTSLVAIHMACRSLLSGECSMAAAGGVALLPYNRSGYLYREGMIDSSDGHCRAFDKNASGTAMGEGVGIVVLKTLDQAEANRDNIYAVVKGSAVNNDGLSKAGYAAPGIEGQARAVKAAHYMAEVGAETIGYVEAHGTGTALGDTVEIEALKLAFNSDQKGYCAVGSVKTNIGNLDRASGAAGFIKTVLALKHKQIPKSLHFETPNPKIGFENSPFYVNTGLREWKNDKGPLRAGVSAFGIGGTNAHIVLEEAPPREKNPEGRQWKMMMLSAKTAEALNKMADNLKEYFKANPGISAADAAYTLQVGRKRFPHRQVFVCSDINGAIQALTETGKSKTLSAPLDMQPTVVFMFPGHGPKTTDINNLGRDLYENEAEFRRHMDRCIEILNDHLDYDIKEILYPLNRSDRSYTSDNSSKSHINRIEIRQPLHFAIEYAQAKLLMRWGITPGAMIAHGIGEYTAACLSGVFSLEDALELVLLHPPGDSPFSVTDPGVEEFQKKISRVKSNPPKIPYLSDRTGDWITAGETVPPAYWDRSFWRVQGTFSRKGSLAVGDKRNFKKEVKKLAEKQPAVFIEVGPVIHLAPHLPHPGKTESDDSYNLFNQIAHLWLQGVEIDWEGFYSGEKRNRISLPTYPFAGDRYWLEEVRPVKKPGAGTNLGKTGASPGIPVRETLSNIWRDFFGNEKIGKQDNFFELGGDSLGALAVISLIHKELDIKVPLETFFTVSTIEKLARYIENAQKSKYLSIDMQEKKEYYPLSSAQKRLYALQQLEKENIGYNQTKVLLLEGELDREKLGKEPGKLIARHEILRTSVEIIGGEAVQRVLPAPGVNAPFEYAEISEAELKKWAGNFVKPFDFTKPPFFRIGLLKIGENRHLLIIDMHHIITDGASLELLTKEWWALYEGEELPALKLQYKDYTGWQRKQKMSGVMKKQEEYWQKVFEGGIPALDLPIDYPRPPNQSFSGDSVHFALEKEETAAIKQLAADRDVTLYIVLLAIYNIFLSKISGQEEIIIGTPAAGRKHVELRSLIGVFINTLPLRNYPDNGKPFAAFLQEVKVASLNAFENQDYQLEELVERLGIKRDTARNPLFDVLLALHIPGHYYRELPGVKKPGLTWRPYEYENGKSIFDISLEFTDLNGRLSARFEYCTKLFKRETVERFVNYIKKIVTSVIEEPGVKPGQLEIVAKEEKERLLYDFNKTDADYSREKSIHQLYEEQVRQTPDHVALVGAKLQNTNHKLQTNSKLQNTNNKQNGALRADFLDAIGEMAAPDDGAVFPGGPVQPVQPVRPVRLTYRQLNERSGELAYILKEKGVVPDTLVGIKAERTVEMIIGILGILKAGGAYLPIDPGYPQERIDYMLKDSGAKVLVTTDNIEGEKVRRWEGEKVLFEEIPGSLKNSTYLLTLLPSYLQSSSNLTYPLTFLPSYLQNSSNPATSLAYVIYTSGSTGRPKGVMVAHRSVVNFIEAICVHIPITNKDILLSLTTICFDIFGLEVLLPLTRGAKVIIGTGAEQSNPTQAARVMEKETVTVFQSTPSMLRLFVTQPGTASALRGLRYLLVGGEPFPEKMLQSLGNLTTGSIFNLYGPTETTIWSTIKDVSGKQAINIGSPLANTRVYILNRNGLVQPIGIAGELLIGGDGLARGYMNQPQLTAEKFIMPSATRNPFEKGFLDLPKLLINHPSPLTFHLSPFTSHLSPLYKTGDLAKWQPDGNIEFIGRIDGQVKIRGYRIELGEIENRLRQHHGIKDVVVINKENGAGDKYLCAYIVTGAAGVGGLREYLSEFLPRYMIPTHIIPLEAIPLTPGGKIDRKALPEPGPAHFVSQEEYVAPRNTVEADMVAIWKELLGREVIGIEDHFLELGGDSIKSIQITAKIREAGYEVELEDILQYPTIHQLAGKIKKVEPPAHRSAKEEENLTTGDFTYDKLSREDLESIEAVFDN